MQIGIFTVAGVTNDPTTGRTPSEQVRIKATVAIAKRAEEIGLDVLATGEHHTRRSSRPRRRPRRPTSPPRPRRSSSPPPPP